MQTKQKSSGIKVAQKEDTKTIFLRFFLSTRSARDMPACGHRRWANATVGPSTTTWRGDWFFRGLNPTNTRKLQ